MPHGHQPGSGCGWSGDELLVGLREALADLALGSRVVVPAVADVSVEDPTVTCRLVEASGEVLYELTLKRSQLTPK